MVKRRAFRLRLVDQARADAHTPPKDLPVVERMSVAERDLRAELGALEAERRCLVEEKRALERRLNDESTACAELHGRLATMLTERESARARMAAARKHLHVLSALCAQGAAGACVDYAELQRTIQAISESLLGRS